MAGLIIEVTPGLDTARRRRANRIGPRHVATSSTYPSLLEHAGFVDIERIDLTDSYRETADGWLSNRIRRADEVRAVLGDEIHADKVAEGGAVIAAIDDGLLRRALYVAGRPT